MARMDAPNALIFHFVGQFSGGPIFLTRSLFRVRDAIRLNLEVIFHAYLILNFLIQKLC